MKKHLLLTCCLVLLSLMHSPSLVEAAPTFRSQKLQKLAAALRLNADSLREGQNLLTVNNRQVKVTVVGGQVTTLGYHLFTDELKAVAATPILTFLERYFLQMDYPEADRPTDRMLREDRFQFKTGSRATVAKLRPDDAFSFNYELRKYVATWTRDNLPLLTVSFPANHELISGENKIESERNFAADVLHAVVQPLSAVDASVLTPTLQNDFYIKKGGNYMNENIVADLYYQKSPAGFSLLQNVSHPLESAGNMAMEASISTGYNLKVTQVMYGYKKQQYDIPLSKWIAYCRSQGCDLYYGIESMTADMVKMTIFAVNAAENYNHLLFVNVPLSVIDRRQGDIQARLETFIPMHNVTNIMAKYRKNKNIERKLYE